MKLVFERAAVRALRRVPVKVARAILIDMEAIAAAPFGRHPQSKPLRGTADGFRLRHGDWRVLYRVDRKTDTVFVEAVKTRAEAYR